MFFFPKNQAKVRETLCSYRNTITIRTRLWKSNDGLSGVDTGSEIPLETQRNSILISDFVISDEKIPNIIRSLNPNKAHGWDEISIRMIKLSDVALVTTLEIIFTNCLRRGVFPEIWRCANVVPVHKKHEKMSRVTSSTDFWEGT